MDVKKVGDHECIQCGKCISVCPAKAISWKGAKLFVRHNDADMPASTEIKPLAGMLKRQDGVIGGEQTSVEKPVENVQETNIPTEVKTDEQE